MKSIAITLALVSLVACKDRDDSAVTDTAATAGASSGAVADTGAAAPTTGTGASGAASATTPTTGKSDTSQNQTQSGVTDTKTGASTLGPDVKKAEPTQGQAVTSKGDTIKAKQP